MSSSSRSSSASSIRCELRLVLGDPAPLDRPLARGSSPRAPPRSPRGRRRAAACSAAAATASACARAARATAEPPPSATKIRRRAEASRMHRRERLCRACSATRPPPRSGAATVQAPQAATGVRRRSPAHDRSSTAASRAFRSQARLAARPRASARRCCSRSSVWRFWSSTSTPRRATSRRRTSQSRPALPGGTLSGIVVLPGSGGRASPRRPSSAAARGRTEATCQPRSSVASSERSSSAPCWTNPDSNALGEPEVARLGFAERVRTDDLRQVGDAPRLRDERVELRGELADGRRGSSPRPPRAASGGRASGAGRTAGRRRARGARARARSAPR